MLFLQLLDLCLCFWRDHAFAVQFTVRTRVRLVAWRQKVGRNIAFGGDVGHDFDFFFDVWQFGKEFRLGVAVQNVFGDCVACFERVTQTGHVSVVQEHLGFQNVSSLTRDCSVIAQRQIQQNSNRRAAFHVRQQFECELWGDFSNGCFAQNDFFQERCFHACGARGAWQGVVNQKLQRICAVFVCFVFDLRDQLSNQCAIVDWLWVQTFAFARFDLVQVISV